MINKRIMPIIFIVLLILLITACGDSSNESSSPAPNASNDKTVTDPLRAYEGTTLNVLIKTGYESAAISEFKDDFEELTGINLQIEVVDEPTLRNRFVLDVTSQTGAYDVVATQFWSVPEFLQLDGLEPLNSYIKNNPSHLLSIDEIPNGLKETYEGEDGDLYGLPVSASGGVLVYRTDLFEEFNIPTPKTTQDVIEAAKVLKENLSSDVVPFVGRGDSSSGSFGSSVGWAWAYGASVLDPESNVTINSESMKEAMNDWVTLMKEYGSRDASAMGWDTMSEMFRQGRAAMNFDMSGFPGVYSDPEMSQVAEHVGVATISGPTNNDAQWMYGEGLGINKYSKNKEAAWLFLQWRTSMEVAEKEVEEGIRYDFPLTSIYESDLYLKNTEDLEFTDSFAGIMESIDTTYWPFVVEFDQVAQAFQEEISLVIAGNQDVDTALEKAQQRIESLVNK